MSERRVRKRRAVPVHNRLVQETLIPAEPDIAGQAAADEVASGAEVAYRSELARWPQRWRERWGRRANALEDQGMGWRAAELRAFAEVG
jgi:hypothetical protein